MAKYNPIIEYDNDGLMVINQQQRGILYEAHISDLHFGTIDPKKEYEILKKQFIDKIAMLYKLDIVSVNGDIFDHKLMSNSDAVYYAVKFIDELVNLCRMRNATLVLISGTPSHDANQLKLFYHYQDDPSIDIRIIVTPQIQWIKGAKILCMPEMHGWPEYEYQKLMSYDWYDQVFGHMTVKGAVYGDNAGTSRLFDVSDFLMSKGPIISGHVHVAGNFIHDFYYTGSPIRYKFGEESPKGYLIVVMDLDNRNYYVNFEEIVSYKYSTIDLLDIINDPKEIIEHINNLKQEQSIDYIRVRFKYIVDGANKVVITNYYHNRPDVKLEFQDIQQEALQRLEEEQKENSVYDFLSNSSMTDEEKFCKYVNLQEGYDFINVDKLKEILEKEL